MSMVNTVRKIQLKMQGEMTRKERHATHKLKMHMKKERNKALYEGNVGCMNSFEKAYFVPASMNRRTLKIITSLRGVPKAAVKPHKHALEINRRLTRGY